MGLKQSINHSWVESYSIFALGRRHTSSPFVAYVVIDKGSFRYTHGTPVAYASSPGVERTHCGRCGSPISYENSNEFGLWIGTLEDATTVTPTLQIFTAEQLPWIEIADNLPRYAYSSKNATPISHGPPLEIGRDLRREREGTRRQASSGV